MKPLAKKKAAHIGAKKKSRSIARQAAGASVPADLPQAENDLVSHMQQGWRLETDSRGGNPVLRDLKSDEVMRPMFANRATVEALEKRGLIVRGKGREPLTMVWRLKTG